MSIASVLAKSKAYFNCEQLHTCMLKKRCIERRQATYPLFGKPYPKHKECQGCPQGIQIKREFLEEMPLPNPIEGKGLRALGCELYSGCVGIAAKKNWQDFNCEQCDYNEDESVVDPAEEIGVSEEVLTEEANEPDLTVYQENKRICEQCGKNPTITPKHRLCPVCMTEIQKQKASKNASNGNGSKKHTPAKAKPQRAAEDEDTALIIDFEAYPDILKQVRDLADEQIRPIESQVIYMLKTYLEKGV